MPMDRRFEYRLRERNKGVPSQGTDGLALLRGLRGGETLLKLQERALGAFPGHKMRVLGPSRSNQCGAA